MIHDFQLMTMTTYTNMVYVRTSINKKTDWFQSNKFDRIQMFKSDDDDGQFGAKDVKFWENIQNSWKSI